MCQALFIRNRFANKFQRTLGMVLYASNVPVKIITVLSKFGLCQAYTTITRQIVKLSEDARDILVRLVAEGKLPFALLYDNINYTRRVKHISATEENVFQSAVVGNLVILDNSVQLLSEEHPKCTEEVFRLVMGPTMKLPDTTARRLCTSPDVLKRSTQPVPPKNAVALELRDVLPTKALDQHLQVCFVTHLVNGFIDANPSLEGLRSEVPLAPAVFPLKRKKSTLYPLPIQRCDEALVVGNIEYVKRTLQHLKKTDLSLEDWLLIVYGDVFSVDRMRSAVAQCQYELSNKHFDKFKFPEPFMGPFHLMVSRLLALRTAPLMLLCEARRHPLVLRRQRRHPSVSG